MDLAQHLRTKNGVEWRAGIANGERVEFFRGKDFAAYLAANPSQMENLPGIEPLKIGAHWVGSTPWLFAADAPTAAVSLQPSHCGCTLLPPPPHSTPPIYTHSSPASGRAISMQIEEVHNQMSRRNLFLRVDRMHKKPKPGRKKLVKFPKKLVYEQDQSWDEDAFYCWTFDRPMSPWLWVGSLALVVVVFLMCLFPLAPYSVKVVSTGLAQHPRPPLCPLSPSQLLMNPHFSRSAVSISDLGSLC